METLKHLLGICGDHWHPNLFTVILFIVVLKFIYEKKFKDTKVGKFLIGKGGVFSSLTDSIPDKGLLGLVKNLIQRRYSASTRQRNCLKTARNG